MLESEIDLLTKQILSENSIKLKYFETTETFGGEKFINSSDEVPKIVEKLSKLSNDIAIITDNPAKYTAINNVKVVGLDSVQGDEFEFAIIDKSWKDTSRHHSLTLKDLYTLTQRSTKGTIIVDNGISLDLKLNTINDMTSAGSIEVPEKDPAAVKFDEISFEEVLDRRLKVMDLTAFTLCRENGLQIIVFDMDTPGNLGKVLAGERIGTLVKK